MPVEKSEADWRSQWSVASSTPPQVCSELETKLTLHFRNTADLPCSCHGLPHCHTVISLHWHNNKNLWEGTLHSQGQHRHAWRTLLRNKERRQETLLPLCLSLSLSLYWQIVMRKLSVSVPEWLDSMGDCVIMFNARLINNADLFLLKAELYKQKMSKVM